MHKIATRTRRAPVRLEVVVAPVDFSLQFFSKNMEGRLEAQLRPAYQVGFSS